MRNGHPASGGRGEGHAFPDREEMQREYYNRFFTRMREEIGTRAKKVDEAFVAFLKAEDEDGRQLAVGDLWLGLADLHNAIQHTSGRNRK